MSYVKENVSFKEFMMHDYIYNLSQSSNGILNVPKIINYNVGKRVMTMENIPHMCVADFYGEKSKDISLDLFDQIREIIRFLYANHIIYPDITGYNFIEHADKLWIIDFEHSDYETEHKNEFVEAFVEYDDYYSWNSHFA
jgi:tRNA A-37 threonylcarbamoyl transferase component Bud32